jgi:uncharacterized membrane protein
MPATCPVGSLRNHPAHVIVSPMGPGSGAYKFVLLLHLVSVVVGLGGVMLNGVYANLAAKGQGSEGVAISEANFAVSNIAEKLIYLIPIFGIGLVFMSDDVWSFSQTWVWLSLVVYVVAIGLSHSTLIPGHKRLNVLGRQLAAGQGGQAEVDEMAAINKKMAPVGATLDLLAVVLIALMVWKPGA